MKCAHCNERPVSRPRGLCYRCFYAPGVADQYPRKKQQRFRTYPLEGREPCLHCKAHRRSRPRGLCLRCFKDPAVKAQYPRLRETNKPEPTAEELEIIIAEQWKNLPAWWSLSAEKVQQPRSERLPRVFSIVKGAFA